jgi:putative SOS response-associated peptidase YedK
MCGRFTLTAKPERLQEVFELQERPANLEPRYNVAPSQPVAVLTHPEERRVEMFRWGLIPSWAKDASIGNRLINARVETMAEKPAFRAAFARRRCLVLADGFYEWQRSDNKSRSQPYYFRLSEGEPFAFAGLYEVWRDPAEANEKVLSCTLITGPANERVARVHDRMPVMLTGEALWRWLDPDASPEALRNVLMPIGPERMEDYPVSTLVNKPSNDSAQLLEPVSL